MRTEKAEVIFVDFCWTNDLIKWNDLLLLLDGHKVHLPTPKNHFSSDLFSVATNKETMKYIGKYKKTDEWEMSYFTKILNFLTPSSKSGQLVLK